MSIISGYKPPEPPETKKKKDRVPRKPRSPRVRETKGVYGPNGFIPYSWTDGICRTGYPVEEAESVPF